MSVTVEGGPNISLKKEEKNHLEIFWFLFDQHKKYFFNEYVITVLNLIQIIKIPTSFNFTSIKPMLWEFPPNYFISGDFQEQAQLLTHSLLNSLAELWIIEWLRFLT